MASLEQQQLQLEPHDGLEASKATHHAFPSAPPPPMPLATPSHCRQALVPRCPDALSACFDDPDLDTAALKLDEHSRLLRGDMLGHLQDWKRRLAERQKGALEAQHLQDGALLAARQQELDGSSAELARHREILKRTGNVLLKAARWRRQHTLACIAWRAWQQHTRRQHCLEANLKAAAQHYDVGKLKRGALRAWRAVAAGQLRLRVKAQAAAAVEMERLRIWQEANAASTQQAQRLAEVEAQLAAALAERQAMEDDMKRAFMRGVSALNIEAMTLMKSGMPPGGVNPFAGDATSHLQHHQQQQRDLYHSTRPISAAHEAHEAAAGNPGSTDWMGQQLLLHKATGAGQGAGSAAGESWSIGAGAPGAAAATSQAMMAQAAGRRAAAAAAGGGAASNSRLYSKPAAELPHPVFSVAASWPVAAMVAPPTSQPTAVRHTTTAAASMTAGHSRPATAAPVPCSLPSNVPPHVAAMLTSRGVAAVAASPARPATAPGRRQHAAAAAAPGQQPQQGSRRSFSGQQRGAPAAGAHPLVVRGAVATQGMAAHSAAVGGRRQ